MPLRRIPGRPAGGLLDRGIGQFAGRIAPQDITGAVVSQLQGILGGDAGLRLAGSRGKRTFFAGGLTPQRFPGAQGAVNSDEALDALPLSAGNRRRALGQAPKLVVSDLRGD